METEQKEIQAKEGESPQQEAPQAPQSVGALLKTERERLGLSREQITEMTRMRTQVVEAIENEAWDSLPPPVFVRGFLRSYAKVLGVSQDTVIDLYTKLVPPESPGLEPRLESSRSRRRRAWFVLLILAVLTAVYGMWHFYASSQVSQGSRETEKRDQEVALQSVPADKKVSSAPPQPAVASPPPVRAAEAPLKPEPSLVQSASQDTPSSPQGGETPARRSGRRRRRVAFPHRDGQGKDLGPNNDRRQGGEGVPFPAGVQASVEGEGKLLHAHRECGGD